VNREKLLNQVKEQESDLQQSNQAICDLISKLRGLLLKVDGGQSEKREARAAAGGRFDAGLKEDTLQRLIEAVRGKINDLERHTEMREMQLYRMLRNEGNVWLQAQQQCDSNPGLYKGSASSYLRCPVIIENLILCSNMRNRRHESACVNKLCAI
jgi:seryl-tRNA synthetase